jgi:hypothetical protein
MATSPSATRWTGGRSGTTATPRWSTPSAPLVSGPWQNPCQTRVSARFLRRMWSPQGRLVSEPCRTPPSRAAMGRAGAVHRVQSPPPDTPPGRTRRLPHTARDRLAERTGRPAGIATRTLRQRAAHSAVLDPKDRTTSTADEDLSRPGIVVQRRPIATSNRGHGEGRLASDSAHVPVVSMARCGTSQANGPAFFVANEVVCMLSIRAKYPESWRYGANSSNPAFCSIKCTTGAPQYNPAFCSLFRHPPSPDCGASVVHEPGSSAGFDTRLRDRRDRRQRVRVPSRLAWLTAGATDR